MAGIKIDTVQEFHKTTTLLLMDDDGYGCYGWWLWFKMGV